ncbi:beta-galactosidase [Bacteroidia bacterium]|nr:beta-galactosidase [Bacteroidia bacterium]
MKKSPAIVVLTVVFFTLTALLQAQERTVPLESSGWKLWLDRQAVWEKDELFLPPADRTKLPVNAPTCGWDHLFKQSLPAGQVQKVIADPQFSLDVKVPGTVEEYCWDALSGDGKGLGSSGNYEGVSWWGKDFTVPFSAKGKRIKLVFTGGIRQRAEIFVNEKLTGYELIHQTPFEIDITEVVKYGETNQLAIRITDANGNFSWGDYSGLLWGDYYFPLSHGFGGILDQVALKIVNPVYVSDIFVKNKPALTDIDAEIEIANEGKKDLSGNISVEIIEAWENNSPVNNPKTLYQKDAGEFQVSGGASGMIHLSASVPDANLWEIGNANLYYFVVTLKDAQGHVIDRFSQRFGFRFLSVEGYGSDARFYFNGKRTVLLSAISWGFWPTNGMYPTPELARKHIVSAQAIGQNMLNFHRCQGNNRVLDAADEMGMLYYEEPGGYSSSRTKDDNPSVKLAKNFELAVQLNSRRFLRMVKQHRNHPSLVMINMVNEPGWNPDEQTKKDMAAAQKTDPTRIISYGSGFMAKGLDEPQKLHVIPYNSTQRTKGFVDIHNAGNSPGVYVDEMYHSPENFWRNDLSKDEIFIWGEEGAVASPPQLELIQQNIAETGYNGWDGADYKDWYQAYTNYIDRKGLKKYYPSLTGLITSLGNIMYYEHGRLVENIRIADGTDLYVLNGYEDMKFDNFSGAVDIFRNLKGDPKLIGQYMRPLMVSVKVRNKIGETGDTNLLDLYVLNEHAIPAGKYTVKAQVKKPDGQTESIFSGSVTVSAGDKFSDLVATQVPVKLDGGKGYYSVTAELTDDQGKKLADGHDELFAVDWKSDKIGGGKGAVIGSADFLRFARDIKKANVVPYDNALGKLDYVILGESDRGDVFKTLPSSATRAKDRQTTGLNLDYFRGRDNFEQVLDRRISTAPIDFDLNSKPIPGYDILGNSNFSLRWEGYIVAEENGETEFSVTFDDGARIWFDNQLVVNRWTDNPKSTETFTVTLKKGKLYPVKIESFQSGGDWLFSLRWKLPVSSQGLDLKKLVERVKNDGTKLLLLAHAESWISELTKMGAFPENKVFHPAKTWVGHNFFVREHPFFEDLPVNGGMNWEYQRLVVYDGPTHFGLYDMQGEEAVVSLVGGASHLVSTSVGIVPCGKGAILFSSLYIEPNLMSKDKAANVPKKIFCNYLKWAGQK